MSGSQAERELPYNVCDFCELRSRSTYSVSTLCSVLAYTMHVFVAGANWAINLFPGKPENAKNHNNKSVTFVLKVYY